MDGAASLVPLQAGKVVEIAVTAGQTFLLPEMVADGSYVLLRHGQDLIVNTAEHGMVVLRDFFSHDSVIAVQGQEQQVLAGRQDAANNRDDSSVENKDVASGRSDQTTIEGESDLRVVYSQGDLSELEALLAQDYSGVIQPSVPHQLADVEPDAGGVGLTGSLLGGLGLGAAAAGGGSGGSPSVNPNTSGPASSAPTSNRSNISGSVVLGEVVADNQLSVNFYNQQRQLVASAKVNEQGRFSVALEDYSGFIMAKLVDEDNARGDYWDEATNQAKDAPDGLMAVSWISGEGDYAMHMTPFSHIAALRAGVVSNSEQAPEVASSMSQQRVMQANTRVAEAFGLSGGNVVSDAPIAVLDAQGSRQDDANEYGYLLAAYSGLEAASGEGTLSLGERFEDYFDDAGDLEHAAMRELFNGAAYAEANNDLLGSMLTDHYDVDYQYDQLVGFTLLTSGSINSYTEQIAVRVDFNDDVSGLSVDDLVVTKAQVLSLEEGVLYLAPIPGVEGYVSIDIKDSVFESEDFANLSFTPYADIEIDTSIPVSLQATLHDADTGLQGDGISNDTRLDFNHLEDGASWQFSVDDGQTWQFGQDEYLLVDDGHYAENSIWLRQIDGAGNIGGVSQLSEAVTFYTQAPITPDALLAKDTGISDRDGISQDLTLLAPINTPEGCEVEYRALLDGVVTLDWNSALPYVWGQGQHLIQIRHTDVAGNESIQTIAARHLRETDYWQYSYSFRLDEGQTEVGNLLASLSPGSEIIGFSGVDAELFDLNWQTGELSFKQAPDYESIEYSLGYPFSDFWSLVDIRDAAGNTVSLNIGVGVEDVQEDPVSEFSPQGEYLVVSQDVRFYPYSLDNWFSASDGGLLTYSVIGGDGPDGVELLANGKLAGTPLESGAFDVVIRATDANGAFIDRPVTMLVKDTPVVQFIRAETATGDKIAQAGDEIFLDVWLTEAMVLDDNDPAPSIVAHINGQVIETHYEANESWETSGRYRFKLQAPADIESDQISLEGIDLGAGAVGETTGLALDADWIGHWTHFTIDNSAPELLLATDPLAMLEGVSGYAYRLLANDVSDLSWSIVDGDDQHLFTIAENLETQAQQLIFNYQPDFENPVDNDTNNIYEVQVQATDELGNTSVQALQLQVLDVNEAPIYRGVEGEIFTLALGQVLPDNLIDSLFVDPEQHAMSVIDVTGDLPSGLLITEDGDIEGAPNEVGEYQFTVWVSDHLGAASEHTFHVKVVAAPVITGFSVSDSVDEPSLGTGGDDLVFLVSMSEPVSINGQVDIVFNVGGEALVASYQGQQDGQYVFTGQAPDSGSRSYMTLSYLDLSAGEVVSVASGVAIDESSVGQVADYRLDNDAPVIASEYSVTTHIDDAHITWLQAEDQSGVVSWSISGGSNQQLFDLSQNGKLTWKQAPTSTDVYGDSYYLEVTARDYFGHEASKQLNIQVSSVNSVEVDGLRLINDEQISYTHVLGAGMLDGPTELDRPTLSGTARPYSQLKLSFDEFDKWVTTDAMGSWHYTFTVNDLALMGVGNEYVYVRGSDDGSTGGDYYQFKVNAIGTTSLNYQHQTDQSIYLQSLIRPESGWENAILSYAFYDDIRMPQDSWTYQEKNAFRDAVQAISNVANVTFVEGDYYDDINAGTNLVLYKENDILFDDGVAAYFYYPDTDRGNQLSGHFNVADWSNPSRGTWDYMVLQHEIGHGLGLRHPFGDRDTVFPGVDASDDDNEGAYDAGDYNLNQGIWSMMAYQSGWDQAAGQTATPMVFDVAALQAIYGANTDYRTDDDTYYMPRGNGSDAWECIWDAGGNDTISNADSDDNCYISLTSYPLLGGLDSEAFVSFVYDDLIKGGFTIADGAIIENAVGGKGDDMLAGNQYANTLTGGEGSDQFGFFWQLGEVDVITDFLVSDNDGIVLDDDVFTALRGDDDLSDNFNNGSSARDANDYLLYDSSTGALYYDADALGAGTAVQFALLQDSPDDLTGQHFSVI